MPSQNEDEIRIGVSSCLLGERVRYDGGHCKDHFLTDILGDHVAFVRVCPEMEIGLPSPRESLRLVHDGSAPPRLIGRKSGDDHAPAMRRFSARKVKELETLDLCGYVLKKDSPSCGLERVRVYAAAAGATGAGSASRDGRGVFATALCAAFPSLPIEEEGRLCDPILRENFLVRVFAYRRLRDAFTRPWKQRDLIDLHAREKLLLLAHEPEGYSRLGRFVARNEGARRERAAAYVQQFMASLAKKATRGRHVNVFEHMLGYFSERLSPADRREVLETLADYKRALVPWLVPATLVRHYVRVFEIEYLARQSYLQPHPKELLLRNHV